MSIRNIIFAGTALVVGGAFWFGASQYKQSEKEKLGFLAQEQSELFVRNHSPRYGNENAKVILTEFLDPECESCRMFYPIVKDFLKEFDGKVQLVVRYAPFHGNSKIAIRALEAARLQGKYWESLELLFFQQPKWGSHHHPRPELIFEYLEGLGLDMEQLRKDMQAPKITAMIDQDFADLRALGVRRTPTFFVNGRPLERFGADELKSLIKEEVETLY